MKKRLLSSLFAVGFAWSLFIGAAPAVGATNPDFAADFAAPPVKTSMKVRTWWPNANTTEEVIREEVRQIAGNGFGCIELICIPRRWERDLALDSVAAEFGWNTDTWNKTMVVLLEEAEKQGIMVDLTVGPHWPAAIPGLDPNSDAAAKKLIHSSTIETAVPGEASVFDLPDAPYFTDDDPVSEAELVALVAAEYSSVTTTISGTTVNAPGANAENTTAVTRTAAIDESTLEVVPMEDIDLENGQFTFNKPEGGEYMFFAFWSIGLGQTAGYTDPSAYVVNHWNTEGAQAVIDLWDETFRSYPEINEHFAAYGGDFFIDSLEITRADIYWSNDMAGYFLENKGYDILKYLPLIMGKGQAGETFRLTASEPITNGTVTIGAGQRYTFGQTVTTTVNPDAGSQVRQDFMFNLSDMFNLNHVKPIQEFAEEHNMNLRMQAQNTGGAGWNDALVSQTYVGVPEGETLGMNSHPDAFRSLAGASNMSGNTHLVSVELGADRVAIYKMTWQRLIENVNRVLSSNANQMVLHGFPTRAQFTDFNKWPGWGPFDVTAYADNWNETQPSWAYMKRFADYVSRLQTAMQYGAAGVDFAVYRYGTTIAGSVTDVQTLFRTAAGNDPWKNPLTNVGYSYNYISPGNFGLENAKVVDGVLNPDYAGYKALVIKDVTTMKLATVAKLKEFAGAGLPIILVGNTVDAGNAANIDGNYSTNEDQAIVEAFTELRGLPKVSAVESEEDLLGEFERLGIKPGASYPAGYISAIRRTGDEMDIYYLFNRSTTQDTPTTENNDTLYHDPAKAISTTVTLEGTGRPYSLDPLTGEIKPVLEYTDNGDGTISIPVTLLDSEALLIAITAVEDYFGDIADLNVVNNSKGGELVYNAGQVVFRAAGEASYDVDVNGGKNIGSVDSVAVPLTLDTGWTLDVESWQPGPGAKLEKTDPNYDVREVITADMGPYTNVTLGEWETVSGELKNISGRGLYTKTFTLEGDFTGAYLNLGKAYDNILEVTINGRVLPPIDQFNHILDLGAYVKQGENTLTVLTGTTLYKANVLAGGWTRTALWTAPYPYEYGLLGGVTVTPYVDVVMEVSE